MVVVVSEVLASPVWEEVAVMVEEELMEEVPVVEEEVVVVVVEEEDARLEGLQRSFAIGRAMDRV